MLRSELLEREAEARRLELAATFDELRARATPGHMLDQLVDYASDSGGIEFFRNLRDQTVANPLALGLVGAGLAWLMMSRSRDGRRDYDPYADFDPDAVPAPRGRMRGYFAGTRARAGNAMSSARHLVSDTAAGVRDRVADAAQGAAHLATGAAQGAAHLATGLATGATGAAHMASDFASDLASGAAGSVASTARSARDTAFGTASSLGERAGDTTAALGDAASGLYGGVSQTAGRTASGMRAFASGTASTGRDVVDFARDQPLVLAGLGLALGAAFGAAFASTATERRVMGETSDDLKERGYAFAAENYDKSRSAAEAVYDEFQHQVRDGGTPAAAGRTGSHAPSLVPLEEEIKELGEKTTLQPERIGLRDDGRG